jgi:hypothetical protein
VSCQWYVVLHWVEACDDSEEVLIKVWGGGGGTRQRRIIELRSGYGRQVLTIASCALPSTWDHGRRKSGSRRRRRRRRNGGGGQGRTDEKRKLNQRQFQAPSPSTRSPSPPIRRFNRRGGDPQDPRPVPHRKLPIPYSAPQSGWAPKEAEIVQAQSSADKGHPQDGRPRCRNRSGTEFS